MGILLSRPTIGPFTVEAANKAGLAAIGVQAGGVLLLDKAALLDACRRYRISLLGL